MKRIRRTELFVKKESIEIYAINSKEKYPFCKVCEGKQIMVPPVLIAEILQISSREIYRRIETKKTHFFEDDSFHLFVCPNSLAKSFQRKKLLY